jgi:hypothetical protein
VQKNVNISEMWDEKTDIAESKSVLSIYSEYYEDDEDGQTQQREEDGFSTPPRSSSQYEQSRNNSNHKTLAFNEL